MKNKMRKMFATLVAAAMMIGMMSVPAMAAGKTMIHNDGEDAYGLGSQNISVKINGTDYDFTGDGEKWTNTDFVEELGLGRGESISVTITDKDGQQYDALLSNFSNGKGNSQDNENGTDHYKFGGITLKEELEKEKLEDEETQDEETQNEEPQNEESKSEETLVEPPEEDVLPAEIFEEEVLAVEIFEEEVPLAELPEEDVLPAEIFEEEVPAVEIFEEEIPLAELPEEEIPLVEVPKTGDLMGLWLALSGVSLTGMALAGKKGKED